MLYTDRVVSSPRVILAPHVHVRPGHETKVRRAKHVTGWLPFYLFLALCLVETNSSL
jgi:hypothetical protein